MSRNKDILPIVMGMDPPTKEVILVRTEKPLKGIACFINYARFPEGIISGQEFGFGDVEVERTGTACWLHFTKPETLYGFGKMLCDFADKNIEGSPDEEDDLSAGTEEPKDGERKEKEKMRPHWITGGNGPFHSDSICSECLVSLNSFFGGSPGRSIASYPRFCPACGERMDGPLH